MPLRNTEKCTKPYRRPAGQALLLLALSLLITALPLAGCSSDGDNPDGTDQPLVTQHIIGQDDTPTEGGVLHIAFITGQEEEIPSATGSDEASDEPTDEPDDQVSPWNPLAPPNREMVDMHSLMFEGLIRFDNNQRAIPALAESWEYDDSGSMLTIHIRENVKFHNGNPLTADDVVHTFDLLREYHAYGRTSIYKNVTKYVSAVEAKDRRTVEVSLVGTDMRALYAMNFPIVPESYDGAIDNMDIPSGTGPYKITSNNGKEIEMDVNTDWWRKQPNIKKIIARAMPNSDTCLSALEAQQVDIVHTTSLTADRFKREGVTNAMELNSQQYECLLVNYDRKPLDNKFFREAIISAIDRKAIINEVYLGHAVSVDAPVTPDSHFFSSSQTQHEYNPAQTLDILSRMSFEDRDEDGILERTGTGTPFIMKLVVAENPLENTRVDVAEIIAEQLLKVGLMCEVEVLPATRYTNALKNGDFDLALAGFSIGMDGDLNFLVHSINSNHNYGGYFNIEMDELLESYVESYMEEEALFISSEIQKLFSDEMPYISLYFRNNSLLYSEAIKNIEYARDMNIYATIEEWYISESRGALLTETDAEVGPQQEDSGDESPTPSAAVTPSPSGATAEPSSSTSEPSASPEQEE